VHKVPKREGTEQHPHLTGQRPEMFTANLLSRDRAFLGNTNIPGVCPIFINAFAQRLSYASSQSQTRHIPNKTGPKNTNGVT